VEGKAYTSRNGNWALGPGEAAVYGPDTVVISVQDGGVVVGVEHRLVVSAGLQARAADDLEGASSSSVRSWGYCICRKTMLVTDFIHQIEILHNGS
jgi:hypothetical protein